MSYVPVSRTPGNSTAPARLELAAPAVHQEPTVGELWGILRRNWWIILGCTVVGAALAGWMTVRATPVYRGTIAIRINAKQSPIPEVLLPLGSGSEVSTEMEVLGSRTLVEDAVSTLGLQLRVVEPTRVARSQLLQNVSVSPTAAAGTFVLTGDGRGHYVMTQDDGNHQTIRPDSAGWLRAPGVAFRVAPEAAKHDQIRIRIGAFSETVAGVSRRVKVKRSAKDANILSLTYESSDPELTSAVPNLIADRFVARRIAGQKAAAGSTIAFLRQQLDTLAGQLRAAEGALLSYRERERVVNPMVEGSSQVSRMVQLQSERSALETERAALAKLVGEVESAATRQAPDDPSPYRGLMAFPTLLRNQTASRLLDVLAAVDGERTQLLARRTPADPDIQTLTARIKGIERDLHSMATTYLQGLSHQVAGMDSSLRGFGRQLQQVPERELRYARLERQPKLLEELFSLLQTRLKEAEIAQAASDLSVQVVDPAIRPTRPVRPRPFLNLFIGVMLGGVVGTAAGFFRDMLDKTVHTRADIMLATGLSVIGLIPRIPRGRSRLALITEKRLPRSSRPDRSTQPKPNGPGTPPTYTPPSHLPSRYTFLDAPLSEAENGSSEPIPVPTSMAAVPLTGGTRQVEMSRRGAMALEAYGGLLTNLSYSLAESPPRVVAFTSGLPGEGKSTNAVNLALALAHRGSKVLLVDCDLRRGVLHNVFEAPREPGLSNVLWGQLSFEQARRSVSVGEHATLDYLTTGTLPPNPTSLVESSTMGDLLARWREEYDGVIIDTPPINVITDAALVGAHADGVVLVARAGVTHATSLGYALEQLRRVQAPVLGVVLSDIDFNRDSAYDPTYRYHRYESYSAVKS